MVAVRESPVSTNAALRTSDPSEGKNGGGRVHALPLARIYMHSAGSSRARVHIYMLPALRGLKHLWTDYLILYIITSYVYCY